MRTFAEAEQRLAERLDGYTPRPQQQRLAAGIEQLFADRYGVLLAQAGCGVGKSLAGVIPAILSGQRTIVATTTKALQEQYANKDLPFLEANLGVPFTWALLKGRANYVCVSKMNEVTADALPRLEQLREELEDPDHTGDFEHLATEIPADKQYLLSMSSNECPGRSECPLADACFAEKAKDAARAADVVVTNTAMLMTDLRIGRDTDGLVQMLGSYSQVLLDEAHELPEIAANSMADQLRRRGVETLLRSVGRFLGEHGSDEGKSLLEDLAVQTEIIFDHLEHVARRTRDEQVEIKLSELSDHIEPYMELTEGLKALFTVVHNTQITHGNALHEGTRQQRLGRRVRALVEKLTGFLTTEGLVRWIEVDKSRRGESIVILKWSPIDVGPFLRETLWDRYPVVLMSATLAVGGDFSYISETLGLSDPRTLDVGTPFDYTRQARLFHPDRNQPDPVKDRSAWLSYTQRTTRELIEQAGGGALLLFTSRKAMKDSYAILSPVLEMAGYTPLMQGEHGTNKELAQRFSEDTHSVLFALKSFFTGVDFAGETCRLVIIDKLPFPVPSEIMFAARAAEMVRRYGSWADFNRLSIPMMSLVLIQGFGRLIRSVNDKGVVAILDPRLASKGYGKKILKALPPAPTTTNLREVAGFYSS